MVHWTLEQRKLFDAVYQATEKQRRFAPVVSLGSDQSLRRVVGKKYVHFVEFQGRNAIEPSNLTMVVDLATNRKAHNRWTGLPAPPAPGMVSVPVPTRGGLYLSADLSAVLSERFHYHGTTRANVTAMARISRSFESMALVVTETKRTLDLVKIDFFSAETQQFIAEIGKASAVQSALQATGAKYVGTDGRPSLLQALFNHDSDRDYAASRGLGLALAAEPDYDGLLVTSAQGYRSQDGGWLGGENNVVLFDADGKPYNDKVGVVQVITLAATGGGLGVTRFLPASGLLVESEYETIPVSK